MPSTIGTDCKRPCVGLDHDEHVAPLLLPMGDAVIARIGARAA